MSVIDLFPEHRTRTLRPTVLQFSLDDTRPETIRQVLWFALRLIEDGRWIQGAFAQDDVGQECDTCTSVDACLFCAAGAVLYVLDLPTADAVDDAAPLACAVFKALLRAIDTSAPAPLDPEESLDMVTTWNDATHQTPATVLGAFNRALAALPERGSAP